MTRSRRPGRAAVIGGLLAPMVLAGCTIAPTDCSMTIIGIDEPVARGDAMPADGDVVATRGDFDLTETAVAQDANGEPAIALVLRPPAAERFQAYTSDHIGGFLAIGLDDVVVSAPMINDAFPGGDILITGPGADPDWIQRFEQCLPVELFGG